MTFLDDLKLSWVQDVQLRDPLWVLWNERSEIMRRHSEGETFQWVIENHPVFLFNREPSELDVLGCPTFARLQLFELERSSSES